MTKACKKRRRVCVSSELGDLSTIFEVDESRLSETDGVTSIPTCEHQSSYELKAESMNTRKIRWCTKILRKLIDHKGGWLFKEPVDPVLYGIPDYFDVIRSPMDLGTVKNKLTKKQYVSFEEFAADVRLTFSNAIKYNPPGNDIHTIAKELNGIFDSKWESVKKKFRGPNPFQEQKTIFTKACKKRREVCVSSELGDSSTVFEVEESRLTIKDGVTSIPTCEHQSSYELKAESMNTRKIRRCTKILRELMDHKSGWIFNQPVDPVLYGLPDYFDVIRNPMDLGTVKKKLTNKQYVSTDEFAADVRLTFSNAIKYNPPGNDIHAIAQQLNGIFDSKWESVKKKFRGPSPVQEQKTIFTKACKKRRGVCVSIELGDSSIVFEAEESRLSKKDGVTPISTCEHQSSYELKAESMNTRKIRLCGDIIRKLIDYKGGWLFKDPVDPVQFGIPDYFDVIHNPMDLGTVKNKLTKKKYVSIEEFAADVRLTFSNAMKYNPPGNDVHTVAKELNRVFDLLWESMKKEI